MSGYESSSGMKIPWNLIPCGFKSHLSQKQFRNQVRMIYNLDNISIVNDDNLTVTGKLPEKLFDLILFDPPFPNLYNGNDYTSFIRERIETSYKSLSPYGNFVTVNYSEPSYLMEDKLNKLGLNKNWNIDIPTVEIYGMKRTKSTEKVCIQSFSKFKTSAENLHLSDIRHSPGHSGVNEAMPSWEVEAIMYLLNIDSSDIVLDMFGGGGTVPNVCNELGAKCISIEIDNNRFNNILNRINTKKPHDKCTILSCNRTAIYQTKDGRLCSNHYQLRRTYIKNKRNALIGINKDLIPIETGKSMCSMINLASAFLSKAERLESYEERESIYSNTISKLRENYGN